MDYPITSSTLDEIRKIIIILSTTISKVALTRQQANDVKKLYLYVLVMIRIANKKLRV